MRGWERVSARAVHMPFYVLMIAVPLLGWATVSSAPLAVPTMWFGLVRMAAYSVSWPICRARKSA